MAASKASKASAKVAGLMGGSRVFAGRIHDVGDVREALRRGLSFDAFEAVREALEISPQVLGDLLGVASRTLARRKKSRQLTPVESDRLYRIAFIMLMAAEVLGSKAKARTWLHRENRALEGLPPLRLLDTEIGERQVEDLLHRINYGIYS